METLANFKIRDHATASMPKPPKTVLISDDQYNVLVGRVEKRKLSKQDWELLLTILKAYGYLVNLLSYQKTTVQKLKDLLFGKRTEKDQKPKDKDDEPPSPGPGDPGPLKTLSPVALAKGEDKSSPLTGPTDNKKKPLGHGRRGHSFWTKALKFFHPHSKLKAGDSCPKCPKGILHAYANPGTWVRFVGQAPLATEVHQLERLRCGSCTEVFTAAPSEDLRKHPQATPEARAVTAIVKYQAATPFNRFANIQKSFGHPIPRTRIWTLCQEMAGYLTGIFLELNKQAAQGDLVQNDDTTVKILDLIKENKAATQAGKKLDRTGMFTTGIVSQVGGRKIYLFFSSRKHAGENLADLLDLRKAEHPPPTQVCDASDMNTTLGGHQTDVGGCHDHARRKFYELLTSFPSSCRYALDEWKIVYHTDKVAKEQNLSPEKRMKLHQLKSQAALERLKAWCDHRLSEKLVDPQGYLGKAMKYFINHYETLTLFLRKPGVPLANIDCERALKIPIGVRKMAYFYKTLTGARVSDIIFSLIATCLAASVNIFDYFVAVQNHCDNVKKAPELWLPWNYQQQLALA
jgi:hypothetical protein